MKRCDHTNWLGLCYHGQEVALLESDRLQTLTRYISNPDTEQPSLFMLIGNAAKSAALRQLFGIKRARGFRSKRSAGGIHLHLDPSTIFHGRPIFLADADSHRQTFKAKPATADKCHETTTRTVRSYAASSGLSLDDVAVSVYTHLIFPFVDTFCFFSADLGGLGPIACQVATWLEKDNTSTIPQCASPRVMIVSDEIPPGPKSENEARETFLWLLREKTPKDPFERISAVDIVALFPVNTISIEARHRPLKERLLDGSDQVRRNRRDSQLLFSVTHFAALFKYACGHFAETIDQPFNFISASRRYNPVASDLEEHLSNFLKHAREPTELTEFAVPIIASSFLLDNYPPGAHMFDPASVSRALYRDVLYRVSNGGVIAFERSSDVILRSGFISLVENHFVDYFRQSIQGAGRSSVEIHGDNLKRFKDQWRDILSDSTCFACLRRRPQYGLCCGHCVCQTCVTNFGDRCPDDPWDFKVRRCFLCTMTMSEEVVVKVHPPTTGAGVLCIDGGGVRGVVPLEFMRRIKDRIGLPIPFQKFFKVAFGISSGGLIILAMFHNGWSIDDSTETFEKLTKLAFKRRKVLDIPLLSRVQELLLSYFADGLYLAKNIEAALKEVFGTYATILDCSYATTAGTRIGLPVATVQEKPSCRIFTNYNGVGEREQNQDHVIKPKDGFGKIPVWEIARSISAAPGFFPPKRIHDVGTFQDSGPLENDPLISALSEVAATFPLTEEPDFVVSLGTGEPKLENEDLATAGSYNIWKNGAFPRLCRMFWEKMRDRKVRQAFKTHPRYHRLDIEFDDAEPRLDDRRSIPELQSKVQTDDSISEVIDSVARCMVASLFYFELDSMPERLDGKSVGTGHIQCSVRRNNPAFLLLLRRLSRNSAVFYFNQYPIPGTIEDTSFLGANGNFRKRVELNVTERFTISLKQGNSQPCNISGSPYSVEKLIVAQGLDAHFGTADHRKRKRAVDDGLLARKRQRT